MTTFVISFIILICGYKIYSKVSSARINWFIGSQLLISSAALLSSSPHISSSFFFILCYFISIMKNKEIKIEQIPMKPLWLIYAIGFIITSYYAEHLSLFSKFWKPLSLFISSYFVLILGFLSAKDFNGISKKISLIILGVCIYGFITYLIKSDPIREIITPNYSYDYYFGSRSRVAATWSHPIAYGFICSLLFGLVYHYKHTHNRIPLLVCLFASILICGSRTVLVVFCLMAAIYVISGLKGIHKWKIIISLLCITFLSYLFIPFVTNKIDQIILSAQGIETVSGSSTDMRKEQMEATLLISSQFPFTGGGFDYIQEVMGYGNNLDDQYWMEFGDLRGFESLIYQILIERGIIGIILELLVFSSLLIWLLKNRKIHKSYSTIGTAYLIGFLTFAIMTGPIDTWTLSMFFIGIYMGKINHIKLFPAVNGKPQTPHS